MDPAKCATSGSEDGEQAAVFCWAANKVADGTYPMLKLMFAIPNGGTRGGNKTQAMIVGGQLKATGVKAGVSDIFLPYPRHNCNGLFIEMKRADGVPSDVSKAQKDFGAGVQDVGYGFVVCYGWIQAVAVIEQYLSS